VTALVANPAAVHVAADGVDWIVSGSWPFRAVDAIEAVDDFDAVVERLQGLPGEYSVIRLAAGGPVPLQAYRSITSTYDVFYGRRPGDDAIVVGDHFRNVLSTLPVADRTVPPSTAVDHLLFGGRPNGTYVEEIRRLGHGETLAWRAGSGPVTTLVDTPAVDEVIDPATAMRRLDAYLEEVGESYRDDPSTVTMLSGGVDSTLLGTYARSEASVSAGFDSPEFAFEVDYATTASDLLGTDHEPLLFREDAFLTHLEAAIDATGQPLPLPQGVLVALAVSETPHQSYLNGTLADDLFGTGAAALAYLGRFLGPACRVFPPVSWEAQALASTAERIRRPVTAPDGAAMNFGIHVDQDQVGEMVGAAAVEARKRRRLDYTLRRVPENGRVGYGAHMHLGHCLAYFNDLTLTNQRHAAFAHGKSLLTPYAGRAVLETSLAIRPDDRYARLSVPPRDHPTQWVLHKYLLKDLLHRRLPDYPTKQRKGQSLLPTGRYLEDGPLADVFDRYALPSFVPWEHRSLVRDGTEELSWYAANYAIWRDRVHENDDLEPVASTVVLER